MNFKEFRRGVTGQSVEQNRMFRTEFKIPFKTNIFLLMVWVFYAKWVYMIRSFKVKRGQKNDD